VHAGICAGGGPNLNGEGPSLPRSGFLQCAANLAVVERAEAEAVYDAGLRRVSGSFSALRLRLGSMGIV
jgi:hypothetical protein